MPQVHNRSLFMSQESSPFGRKSRFMVATKMSDTSRRRIQALNELENRQVENRLRQIKKLAIRDELKQQKLKLKLEERLLRITAYQEVAEHNHSELVDNYQAALDKKYSLKALKPQLIEAAQKLHPAYRREQRAIKQLEQAKHVQDCITVRNLERIPSARTRARGYIRPEFLPRNSRTSEVFLSRSHFPRLEPT